MATAALLLSSCATGGSGKVEPEAFGSTTTHSRNYGNPPAFTCEAARRALLSQGFVIFAADADHVNGRKNFQPQPESHVEIEFHATCVADGRGGKSTIAFVNALQDRYALKKSNNSASVGVGAFGSLSLPFTSSDDAMVKVASETITSAPFYDKFFALLDRYLVADSDMMEDMKLEPVIKAEPPRPGPTKAPVVAMPAASASAAALAPASEPPLAPASAPPLAPASAPPPAPASAPAATPPEPAASAPS